MLRHASDEQLLIIVEVALNILKANFQLTNRQKQKLMPFAETVRQLSRARRPHRARQIVQIGGGVMLPALLMPIVVELGRYLVDKYGS